MRLQGEPPVPQLAWNHEPKLGVAPPVVASPSLRTSLLVHSALDRDRTYLPDLPSLPLGIREPPIRHRRPATLSVIRRTKRQFVRPTRNGGRVPLSTRPPFLCSILIARTLLAQSLARGPSERKLVERHGRLVGRVPGGIRG